MREAAPLACMLSLALIAVTAHAQTAAPQAPPAATAAAAKAPATATKAGTPAATKAAATTASPATPAPATVATAQAKTTKSATTQTAGARPAGATPAVAKTAATTAATVAASPKATATKKSARADSTATAAAATKKGAGATSDADYTLRGGQEGTVFKSLTIEGEDRVHVDFERPELKLDLDLEKAPGLDWGSAADVLNRTATDLDAPLVGLSAKQTNPYLGRPWLSEFATGPVARFHPAAEGVDHWKLVVVDSKGAAVRTFAGKGDPPKEIDWDGRDASGTPVTPGLTYSYVFEAHDKAGNKRNVVGQGFAVTAYRVDAPEGPTLLFSATELQNTAGTPNPSAAAGANDAPPVPPILLEAASWMNQAELSRPIKVTATARSQELADALANNVKRALTALVLGDPARLDAVALVEADAPEGGTLAIAPAK
jgi:hypothetical protein